MVFFKDTGPTHAPVDRPDSCIYMPCYMDSGCLGERKQMKLGRKSGRGIGNELEGREWEVDLIQIYCMHVWVLNKISLKGGLTEECSALNGTSISKAQGSTWKRGRGGCKAHRW